MCSRPAGGPGLLRPRPQLPADVPAPVLGQRPRSRATPGKGEPVAGLEARPFLRRQPRTHARGRDLPGYRRRRGLALQPRAAGRPAHLAGVHHKFVAKVHSLTVADVEGARLTIRQISRTGEELDRFIADQVRAPAHPPGPEDPAGLDEHGELGAGDVESADRAVREGREPAVGVEQHPIGPKSAMARRARAGPPRSSRSGRSSGPPRRRRCEDAAAVPSGSRSRRPVACRVLGRAFRPAAPAKSGSERSVVADQRGGVIASPVPPADVNREAFPRAGRRGFASGANRRASTPRPAPLLAEGRRT